MARKRRKFTKEYKAEAVRLAREGAKVGKSAGAMAKELDLTETALRSWIKQADTDEGHGPEGALTSDEKSELSALRKEVRVLRMERELLKKAAAFFAKESSEVRVHRGGEGALVGRVHVRPARGLQERLLRVARTAALVALDRGRAVAGGDSCRARREPWPVRQPARTPRARRQRRPRQQASGRPTDAENGLRGRRRRRFRHTTDSDHAMPIAPNTLARDFAVEAPNEVWVTDITYIPTREGWLYLAVMLDLYSRRVVGWSMSDQDHPAADARRALDGTAGSDATAGLLHHSDRGTQYASADYRAALASAGIECSMSRKGDCWDNAVAESFFATLKTELVHEADWATRAEARSAIFEYLEVFYNRRRIHSSIGYVSPEEFELKYERERIAA